MIIHEDACIACCSQCLVCGDGWSAGSRMRSKIFAKMDICCHDRPLDVREFRISRHSEQHVTGHC